MLVDEASMVPTLTLEELTRAAKARGCRVGLVGDYAQMGAPEAGGLLRDLAELPSARRLTTVRRFREQWERRASIELQARDQTTSINYFEHERIVETTSDRQHERAATRRHDLAREKATRWWHVTSQRLPAPARVATSERADAVVAVLAGLSPACWPAVVNTAIPSTDWRATDAGARFASELSRAAVPIRVDLTSGTPPASRDHAR